MLMIGSQIIQFIDVDGKSDASILGIIQIAQENADSSSSIKKTGDYSIWALIFVANIFSTAHIVLEITGLSLFTISSVWIFWRSRVLDIPHSGGFWITGFIGIIFWNISFYALRSMCWNSRSDSRGVWYLSGLNNAWVVYLISNSVSSIMMIVGVIFQNDSMFDGRLLTTKGATTPSGRNAAVVALKIGLIVAICLVSLSLICAVYGEDFKIGLYLLVGGTAIISIEFLAYLTAFLVNRRRLVEEEEYTDMDESESQKFLIN